MLKAMLLASAALVTGSPAPPPPPERAPRPCAEAKKPAGGPGERRMLEADKPTAAQRVIPGLF